MQNINLKDIYILIKSLSQSEKAYFKKFSNQHIKGDKNNYVFIFEVFDKTNTYDEIILYQKIKKLNIKNISRVNNYLYDTLLKSLISYHSQNSIDAEIREDLRKIEVLWDKSLHEQCFKQVTKLKKTLIKFDKKLFLIELLEWEAKINFEKLIYDDVYKDLIYINKIQSENINQYKKELEFDALGRSLSILFHTNGKNKILESSFYNDKVESLLKKAKEDDLPDGILKIVYYFTQSIYQIQINKLDKSKIYSEKLINYLKKNPNYIISDLRRYIVTLTNNIIFNLETNDYINASMYIELLSEVISKYSKYCSEELIKMVKIDYFIYKINLLMLLNKYHDLKIFLLNINDLSQNNLNFSNMGREVLCYYSVSKSYFVLGEFKKSLLWINKFINDERLEKSYLYANALIFNLLIHFELGNFDILENKIRSVKRYLKKINSSHELGILNLFENLVLSKLNKQAIKNFKDLVKNNTLGNNTNYAQYKIENWIVEKVKKNHIL